MLYCLEKLEKSPQRWVFRPQTPELLLQSPATVTSSKGRFQL